MAEAVAPGSGKEPPIGFLGLMRNRNYALLWWGQLVSELGNRFHWVAVSLWVYSATHSASAVSVAISSMFVGGMFVSLWAGVLVDRFDRKKILIASDLIRSILVALIPFLMGLNIWLVYADLALISVATAFFRPAMFAVVPSAVSRRDLLPANSFFTAMDTGTEIVGPAIAGIIAFGYGYAPLLYFDAATYVFSALCLLGISLPSLTQAPDLRSVGQPMKAAIFEGLRYIRQERLQWQLFVLIFPAYLVGSGLNALQTPLAKGTVGISDVEFGTFNSVLGVGFLVASLLLGWFGASVRKSWLIIGGFFLQFASTAAMGLSTSLQVLLATAFAVGFANTLNYVGLSTVLMEYTPREMIGRVISTRQLALGTIRILSPLVFGGLGDVIGVRESVLAMAAVGAIGTATVVVNSPVLREFDAAGGRSGGPTGRIWRAIFGVPVPEFDVIQQVRLSSATLVIVLTVLVGLGSRSIYNAIGLLVSVCTTVLVGVLVKGRFWERGKRLVEQTFDMTRRRAGSKPRSH